LLDAASLWVFVAAFSHFISPIDLLMAYGLANILAAIPITPGGLGVVEFVLVSMITGFGPTAGAALSGVLAYRAVNFWLPIPFGGLAYGSLEFERHPIYRRFGRFLHYRLRHGQAPVTGATVTAATGTVTTVEGASVAGVGDPGPGTVVPARTPAAGVPGTHPADALRPVVRSPAGGPAATMTRRRPVEVAPAGEPRRARRGGRRVGSARRHADGVETRGPALRSDPAG
jgi:hypothetical protein